MRELILRKCAPEAEQTVREIFEKEPFGTLERLVTQKLLDVVKRVTRTELEDEGWLLRVAPQSDRSHEELHAIVRAFLETDIFNISADTCVDVSRSADRVVEHRSGDVRNGDRAQPPPRARAPDDDRVRGAGIVAQRWIAEPGLQSFLQDASLSGDVTAEEVAFLKSLKIARRRPTPLYYYREAAEPSRPAPLPPGSIIKVLS